MKRNISILVIVLVLTVMVAGGYTQAHTIHASTAFDALHKELVSHSLNDPDISYMEKRLSLRHDYGMAVYLKDLSALVVPLKNHEDQVAAVQVVTKNDKQQFESQVTYTTAASTCWHTCMVSTLSGAALACFLTPAGPWCTSNVMNIIAAADLACTIFCDTDPGSGGGGGSDPPPSANSCTECIKK